MAQLLAILRVFLALLPIIREAVMTVEAAVPLNGAGQQKLAMVKEMVEAGFKLAGQMQVTFEQVWPSIQNLITAMVAAYNATGTFKRE